MIKNLKYCIILALFLAMRSNFGYANCNKINHLYLPATISQVIVVAATQSQARLTRCQRSLTSWQQIGLTIPAVIGRHGVVLAKNKKEGDLKTPAGLYSIGETFGTQRMALKMDYKYITSRDKFIDDTHSQQYNMWVTGDTSAKSFEVMQIPSYKMGAVINYNVQPTKAGAGSAIFIHIWKSRITPTHGCIAVNEKNMLEILYWLDKEQYPAIYIYSLQKLKYLHKNV